MNHLRITEIFHSIQGEGCYNGFPSHFIRLSGCNIKCPYCDTRYSWDEGRSCSTREILEELAHLPPARYITVTGGEPLLQEPVYELLEELRDRYDRVILETNGTISIERVPSFVHIAMDLKPPSSGAVDLNRFENLEILKNSDEVKILILNKHDFLWAIEINGKFNISKRHCLSLTPVFGFMDPVKLAEWILESGENIRLNLQLHKFLWGEIRGK